MTLYRAEKLAYYFALSLAVYMPLHIFIAQSFSLVTGGLELWKAAKDVALVLAVFPLLFVAYKQGAFANRFFKTFIGLGALYVLLYVLFLAFDTNDDILSAITGSVYNTRLLGYFLLGWVVANAKQGSMYAKNVVRTVLVMCMVVAAFGVLQYFLPKDLLTHFGYSIERGVKPMFFIDDKPDFPRVMSTLRDPNSLGAFLALPITYAVYFLFLRRQKSEWQVVSRRFLLGLLLVSGACLLLTFSRSGLLTVLSSVAALTVFSVKNKRHYVKKVAPYVVVIVVGLSGVYFVAKDTYFVKNVVLHADESSAELDPNELRVALNKAAIERIRKQPFGQGPGSAGIVSISNTKTTNLTENYFLQIAEEVGILGLALFIALFITVCVALYASGTALAVPVLSVGVGMLVFSVLNHAWSNEAVALGWWLLAGVAIGKQRKHEKN